MLIIIIINRLHHYSTVCPIAHVPLFDSINNVDIREDLYTQYRQVIEQSKMDMFNLYSNCAQTQMQYYEREHKTMKLDNMWQAQRLLPQDQKLSTDYDKVDYRTC